MADGTFGPADLLRAVRTLQAEDAETREAIAAVLGLGPAPAPPSPAPQPPPARANAARDPHEQPAREPGPDELPPMPPFPHRLPGDHHRYGRVETVIRERRPAGRYVPVPEWVRGAPALASPRPLPAPAAEPLFPPRQQRAILGAALATYVAEGGLDVAAAVRAAVSLHPFDRLPRLLMRTLRRGVQVLVDRSAGMEPFAQDAESMVRAVAEVAGRPRTVVLAFRGSPPWEVETHAGERILWEPPARGTPVLLVSDLGIGGPPLNPDRPRREEWLELARRARRAGCPLVALVPFSPRRWDPVLARRITHLHWDRGTGVGTVRRALARARRAA